MLSKSLIRIGINILLLSVVCIPIHMFIGGDLYPDGVVRSAEASVFMYAVVIVLIVLYAENILWGFMAASMIALTNFFSIIPGWLYKIEGIIRVDDLALIITIAVLLVKLPSRTVRPQLFHRAIALILGFVVFQYVYTVLFVGEHPWMALREIRPYVHYLWFFLPFYVFTESRDVIRYLSILIVGTVVNAIVYIPQVVFYIDLGYVDTTLLETLGGATAWRVWQGVPDLLLPGLFFFFVMIFFKKQYDIWHLAGFSVLLLALFLTSNRSFMLTIPVAVLGGMLLFIRPTLAGILRYTAVVVIAGGFIIGVVAVASALMGVENILLARFDETRPTIQEMFSRDANLLVRLGLLGSVVTSVNSINPLLGLGFIGIGTDLAQSVGIEYFGEFLIRNNDIGLATIIGQGGWLFFGLTYGMLIVICFRLFRFRGFRDHPELHILSIALICFIAAQIPLSITSFGLTSTQVIATIATGLACIELLYRFQVNPEVNT